MSVNLPPILPGHASFTCGLGITEEPEQNRAGSSSGVLRDTGKNGLHVESAHSRLCGPWEAEAGPVSPLMSLREREAITKRLRLPQAKVWGGTRKRPMPSLVAQVDTHTRNEERTSASERGEDVGHRAKRSVAGPSVRPGSGDLWEVLGLDVDLSGHGASGFGGRGWESQAPRCPQGSARQSAGPANADGFGQITGESGPRAVRN